MLLKLRTLVGNSESRIDFVVSFGPLCRSLVAISNLRFSIIWSDLSHPFKEERDVRASLTLAQFTVANIATSAGTHGSAFYD